MTFYYLSEEMGLALNDILRRVCSYNKDFSREDISITWINYKSKNKSVFKGFGTEDEILLKELLKKFKVFCGTGGILIDRNIQLQGDMVSKSIEFLRKEGFRNLWSKG